MSDRKFSIGDVVKLNAGGPDMSVNTYDLRGVRCQWFAGKKLEYGYFSEQTLVKVENDQEEDQDAN